MESAGIEISTIEKNSVWMSVLEEKCDNLDESHKKHPGGCHEDDALDSQCKHFSNETALKRKLQEEMMYHLRR